MKKKEKKRKEKKSQKKEITQKFNLNDEFGYQTCLPFFQIITPMLVKVKSKDARFF